MVKIDKNRIQKQILVKKIKNKEIIASQQKTYYDIT